MRHVFPIVFLREIDKFDINALDKLISRNFDPLMNHSVVISEIYSHRKNISSNHLFSNLFSKHVAFTKFLPKMRESKFPKLPHCAVWKGDRIHWKLTFCLQSLEPWKKSSPMGWWDIKTFSFVASRVNRQQSCWSRVPHWICGEVKDEKLISC